MNLLNPWYLTGLAAVAVPILIHILQRDRIRRIVFPATRFLLGASRNITRTQALRELILLILRATAMFLLALALTRPFFMKADEASAAGGTAGKVAVVVIDTSASMRIGSRMQEARQQALDSIGKYHAHIDRVALMTIDQEARRVVDLTGNLDEVRAAINTLEAGYGGTNLLAGLREADRLLQGDDYKHVGREIVLVSDLQRSGWSQFHGDWRVMPGTDLRVKPVALSAADNVAITQVAIPKSSVVSTRAEPLSLQVVNFGRQERKNVKVTLTIDGAKIDEKFVNLGPGKTEVVRFTYKFEKPGDSAGTIVVDAKDDFPDDNSWFFNVRVLPRVQVLLVNGSPNAAAAKDDGRFVKEALSVPGTPFQVREIGPQAFTAKDLEGCQAVVFANVGSLAEALAGPMKTFIENGGGIMVFPGDRVIADDFNRSFTGLVPCRLKQVCAKDDKSEGWTIGEIELQHPIFQHFTTPQSGDFASAKFSKYFSITDSQAARVLARYIDGPPALLEQGIGKGYSLLFTSSAGMKWNDFCLQGGVFVPFIHESMKYLAVHSEGITAAAVGEALAFGGAKVEVIRPDGEKLKPAPGSAALSAPMPGIYAVKNGDKDEKLAVNIPRAEAEPAMMDGQEMIAAVASDPDGQQKVIEGHKVWVAASNSVRERIEGGQKLGWYLLIALVVLLFAEHVLANNTSRR
ncbi:MAG: VWA domain-containing protein [Planctomycetota bacterium]|nr:VWA domain-containing protein [Planctomycetota bacterium]